MKIIRIIKSRENTKNEDDAEALTTEYRAAAATAAEKAKVKELLRADIKPDKNDVYLYVFD